MHIAITADYVDPKNFGGAGRVLAEVASRLVRRGNQVTVVAGGPEEVDEKREVLGSRMRWISFRYRTRGARGIGFFLSTRRAIRRAWGKLSIEPERVIHHQPFTAHAIGPLEVPVTYFFHSPWPLEYLADRFGEASLARLGEYGTMTRMQVRFRRRIEAAAIARAEQILCLSKSMKRLACDLYSIPENKVHVEPGAVDLSRFRPVDTRTAAAIRNRYQVPPQGLLLCSVRRMIPRTGLDLLLRALAHLGSELGPYRLVIPGIGPERESLETLAVELGIEGQVTFTGYLPDRELPLLYAASDLSIVPTRTLEGFGLSTLESLACETPVIATPVGGSVEILQDLEPRLLTRKIGHQALAEQILLWGKHREQLAALRLKCRTYVQSRYAWERMTRAVLDEGVDLLPLPDLAP